MTIEDNDRKENLDEIRKHQEQKYKLQTELDKKEKSEPKPYTPPVVSSEKPTDPPKKVSSGSGGSGSGGGSGDGEWPNLFPTWDDLKGLFKIFLWASVAIVGVFFIGSILLVGYEQLRSVFGGSDKQAIVTEKIKDGLINIRQGFDEVRNTEFFTRVDSKEKSFDMDLLFNLQEINDDLRLEVRELKAKLAKKPTVKIKWKDRIVKKVVKKIIEVPSKPKIIEKIVKVQSNECRYFDLWSKQFFTNQDTWAHSLNWQFTFNHRGQPPRCAYYKGNQLVEVNCVKPKSQRLTPKQTKDINELYKQRRQNELKLRERTLKKLKELP